MHEELRCSSKTWCSYLFSDVDTRPRFKDTHKTSGRKRNPTRLRNRELVYHADKVITMYEASIQCDKDRSGEDVVRAWRSLPGNWMIFGRNECK